jgi:hypothetical protein
VSLRTARDRREDARRLLADGIDPVAQRRTELRTRRVSANTFEAIGRSPSGENRLARLKAVADPNIRV